MNHAEERDYHGEERIPILKERYSFDDLARGVASGTISRGRALNMAGAALLGAALIPFSAAPAEAANACKGKRPLCSQGQDKCKGDRNCACARIKGGGKRCVDIQGEGCPPQRQCNSTSDCPGNQVCADVSGCRGQGIGDCLRPCP